MVARGVWTPSFGGGDPVRPYHSQCSHGGTTEAGVTTENQVDLKRLEETGRAWVETTEDWQVARWDHRVGKARMRPGRTRWRPRLETTGRWIFQQARDWWCVVRLQRWKPEEVPRKWDRETAKGLGVREKPRSQCKCMETNSSKSVVSTKGGDEVIPKYPDSSG